MRKTVRVLLAIPVPKPYVDRGPRLAAPTAAHGDLYAHAEPRGLAPSFAGRRSSVPLDGGSGGSWTAAIALALGEAVLTLDNPIRSSAISG